VLDPSLDERYDELAATLHSAVLADVMDDLGLRNQGMDHGIRPIFATATLIGRAATAIAVDVDEIPDSPYERTIELLDGLRPGEVVVCATGKSTSAACWGELLSTGSRANGARGVVTDGLCRDVAKIELLGFPVFAGGIKPLDSKGRLDVVEIRSGATVGGVDVEEGDLVVGDVDGVVIVPRAVEDEVIARALEKVAREGDVRQRLQEGATLRATFDDLGVL
jgi:regulator of RNase E activity RraA